MKKSECMDKIQSYGFAALSDKELMVICGFKESAKYPEFYGSPIFRAAKELIKRREMEERKKIASSKNAVEILSHLEGLDHEEFWTIYLNRANKVIKVNQISKGSTTGTVVDVQAIFKQAIELKAAGIILGHNHPSGNLQPSDADKKITDRIKQGANIFDINLLDHVILSDGGKYFSFADEGLI